MLKVDADSVLAQYHNKLRDEQEKYFNMMNEIMGPDRQRNWSESDKTGRMFILFVAQILGYYLGNVCRSKLSDKFSSIPYVLGEMRPIHYIEHPNTNSFIALFVGQQVISAKHLDLTSRKDARPSMSFKKRIKANAYVLVRTSW